MSADETLRRASLDIDSAPAPVVPVLALDLATTTGWAMRSRDGSVASGVHVFDLKRGESAGMRFLRFRKWLKEVLALGDFQCRPGYYGRPPGVIAYEAAHHRGGHATALAVGLVTIVQEVAAERGLETTSVHTATLKKHATGKGNAKKPDMIRAACERWDAYLNNVEPIGEDEADALCVLSWALEEVGG